MTEEIDGRREGYDYGVFGLRITSELRLPELTLLRADHRAPPGIAIQILRSGVLHGVLSARPLHVDGHEVVLTVENVARYRIFGGRQISIEPCFAATERSIRLFLLGSAFGIVLHQRGLLPLHATAVVVNGGAVAFAGRGGIGKSTLAAHFLSRGFEVLCDDICVTSFSADSRPMAWPGPPYLKLWRDTAEAYGHDCAKLPRVLDELDKYRVPRAGSAGIGPFPMARFYALSDLAAGAKADIVPLGGSAAVRAVMANTYRKKYLRPMGLGSANLLQAAAVAQHVQIFAAPRRRGVDVVQAEADRLEYHMTLRNAGSGRVAGEFNDPVKHGQAG